MVTIPKPNLNDYQAFLLDVDGVIVCGKQPLPGAVASVGLLQQRGKVLFFSNNASLSPDAYAHKLRALGIDVSPEQILNSGSLVTRYLDQHASQDAVYVVGEPGLCEEVARAGHPLDAPSATWLVTSVDRKFSYDKLNLGLQVLLRGGRWVASNTDEVYPTPEGFVPGAGSIVGAFCGMGFVPEIVVGKPSKFSMDQALSALNVTDPKRVLMIGDRLQSDIQGAHLVGIDSVLLLCGVTQPAQLKQSDLKPTFVAQDLRSLLEG